MEKCNICGNVFKLVPAGVSKTSGKPYSAFYACSTRGCKGKPVSPSTQTNATLPPKNANGEVSKGNSDTLLSAILVELKQINSHLQIIAKCEIRDKVSKMPHEEVNPFEPEL